MRFGFSLERLGQALLRVTVRHATRLGSARGRSLGLCFTIRRSCSATHQVVLASHGVATLDRLGEGAGVSKWRGSGGRSSRSSRPSASPWRSHLASRPSSARTHMLAGSTSYRSVSSGTGFRRGTCGVSSATWRALRTSGCGEGARAAHRRRLLTGFAQCAVCGGSLVRVREMARWPPPAFAG
jgi:hypothetical protein